MRDAIRREISFAGPEGKQYKLNEKTAVLLVRPRGWHLTEKHFQVDGEPISGGLFDFGLYFFHNAEELIRRGSRPLLLSAEARIAISKHASGTMFSFSRRIISASRKAQSARLC